MMQDKTSKKRSHLYQISRAVRFPNGKVTDIVEKIGTDEEAEEFINRIKKEYGVEVIHVFL